jgi:hypothetical protein
MQSSSGLSSRSRSYARVVGGAALFALSLSWIASAQYGRGDGPLTRLLPGMAINVRTNEPIDTRGIDYRVFTGIVDQDVRGDNGRLAIPRGSTAELIVRRSRNDEMVLDLESVVVNGQRYAVETDPNRVEGTTGSDSLVGAIVGTITGVRGPEVRLPPRTQLTFRLERPLTMGVADRGVMRDGYHYHDYYGRDR